MLHSHFFFVIQYCTQYKIKKIWCYHSNVKRSVHHVIHLCIKCKPLSYLDNQVCFFFFLIYKEKFKCRTNKMLTACAAHYKYTILAIYGDDTVLLRWKFSIYTSEKAAFYIFLYPFYVCKWFAYFMLSYHFSYIRWQTSLV
jgi:hypothetical protein